MELFGSLQKTEKLWNCEICEIENSVFAEYAGAKGN